MCPTQSGYSLAHVRAMHASAWPAGGSSVNVMEADYASTILLSCIAANRIPRPLRCINRSASSSSRTIFVVRSCVGCQVLTWWPLAMPALLHKVERHCLALKDATMRLIQCGTGVKRVLDQQWGVYAYCAAAGCYNNRPYKHRYYSSLPRTDPSSSQHGHSIAGIGRRYSHH